MKPSNIDELRRSFTTQAAGFESGTYHLSKKEYLDYLVLRCEPKAADQLLEVAAGTCVCGRALAPYCNHVTCLDLTPAMLETGRSEAEKQGITNISYVTGVAEELPFLDNSFDLVISRLAFHHFVNPQVIFAEQARVLKKNGRLVLWDMVPANLALREEIDRIETLRDPSHTREMSKEEMQKLYADTGLTLTLQEELEIPVSLEGWMELTKTPEEVRNEIRTMMEKDLSGEITTGFMPYRTEEGIFFHHHWVLNIGTR